jgi:hypothetical protein
LILSSHVSDEKIFLFFARFGNSIPNLVRLSGLWRMTLRVILVEKSEGQEVLIGVESIVSSREKFTANL